MVTAKKDGEHKVRTESNGTSSDSASTLLPMLVGGLVLTVIGLIVVVTFV